jgi:hypothetical protein
MHANSTGAAAAKGQGEQTPAAHTKLTVKTSPNAELMLVVAMLVPPTPSPGHYGTVDHPIPQAAQRWFAPYADHAAVATVRRLFYIPDAGFACDALTSFILRRDEPPDLAARYPHSRSALDRAAGDARVLDRLVDQLRDFYHVSRFASFWEEHAAAYQSIAGRTAGDVRAGWAGEDVVATLETYFGEERQAYVLIPTPMERPGGGTMDPMGEDRDHIVACFDCTVDKDWVLYLLYHEVGHGFVNPLAERYSALVARYEPLYPPLEEAMRPWGYVTWTTALNEHVLRAQNCRLRRQLLGDAAAEEQLDREEHQGFAYVRALDAQLAEYETQRARYPTLADFYPVLLTALDPLLASGEPG